MGGCWRLVDAGGWGTLGPWGMWEAVGMLGAGGLWLSSLGTGACRKIH